MVTIDTLESDSEQIPEPCRQFGDNTEYKLGDTNELDEIVVN